MANRHDAQALPEASITDEERREMIRKLLGRVEIDWDELHALFARITADLIKTSVEDAQ